MFRRKNRRKTPKREYAKKEAYLSTKAMNQEKKQKLINRAIELRKKDLLFQRLLNSYIYQKVPLNAI